MPETDDTARRDNALGTRLRALREARGLTQRELAARAGVASTTVSMIETDRISPSVSSLKRVVSALGLSLAEFFADGEQETPSVFFRAADMPDIGTGNIAFRLLAANRHDRAMTIVHERYPPGSDTGEESLSHSGEEGGVVVRGTIELTVDGHTEMLQEGDGYYFDSRLPHRFRNPSSDTPCEIISANTPPSL